VTPPRTTSNSPFSGTDSTESNSLLRRKVDHNESVSSGELGISDSLFFSVREDGVVVSCKKMS